MIKGRPPRLTRIFDTYDCPLYFVTASTLDRRPFPLLPNAHKAFVEYARRAETLHIAVGRYVLMPDHMHLFVCGRREFVLSEWIKGLKRCVSSALRSDGSPFRWQPGFFDHLLRNDESYAQKWNYVRENPVRAGLVKRAEDWPYAGEIVYI
ncbi:MAG: transposase, partial [Chthoniobacterales bacterium]